MSTRPESGLAPGTRVTVVIDGRTCTGVVQHYEPDLHLTHGTFPVRFIATGQWRLLTAHDVTVVETHEGGLAVPLTGWARRRGAGVRLGCSEAAASAVFSVRLPPATYEAVRAAAARAHLTPSALIRQWVTERVEETGSGDLATAVATLRRDVERVADLVRPA